MKRNFLMLCSLLLIAATVSRAQTSAPMRYRDPVKTGDTTITVPRLLNQGANLYNHISDIFQAAIHNGIINSSNGEYQITFSPYALDELFRKNKFTDIDYLNKKNLRNINFTFIVGTDKNNNLTSFSPSVKWSIVNGRDVSNFLNAPIVIRDSLTKAESQLLEATNQLAADLTDLQNKYKADPQKLDTIRKAILALNSMKDSTSDQISSFFKKQNITPNSDDLKKYQLVVDNVNHVKAQVAKVVASIQKGTLLTLQGSSLVKNNSVYGLTAKLEYLKGTGWKTDKSMPWDIDAYVSANVGRDSLIRSTVLERQVLSAYFGLNKALITTTNQPNATTETESLLEVKGSAGLDYIPWVKFQKEKTWNPAIDFVLSTRLAANLYLPFELKYVQSNHSLFGFLNLQFNLPQSSGTKQ